MFETVSSIPCQVIPFPLTKRIAAIRDVASKLMDKATDRQAEVYRNKVAGMLFDSLAKLDIPEDEQDEQVGAFFTAVELELLRLYDLNDLYGDRSS